MTRRRDTLQRYGCAVSAAGERGDGKEGFRIARPSVSFIAWTWGGQAAVMISIRGGGGGTVFPILPASFLFSAAAVSGRGEHR
jgi:hypothetical protein